MAHQMIGKHDFLKHVVRHNLDRAEYQLYSDCKLTKLLQRTDGVMTL